MTLNIDLNEPFNNYDGMLSLKKNDVLTKNKNRAPTPINLNVRFFLEDVFDLNTRPPHKEESQNEVDDVFTFNNTDNNVNDLFEDDVGNMYTNNGSNGENEDIDSLSEGNCMLI
ncbi:unnamed protein product [Lathyrus sativus]|nr:unnamed protein product [Lathyrus sativus]